MVMRILENLEFLNGLPVERDILDANPNVSIVHGCGFPSTGVLLVSLLYHTLFAGLI